MAEKSFLPPSEIRRALFGSHRILMLSRYFPSATLQLPCTFFLHPLPTIINSRLFKQTKMWHTGTSFEEYIAPDTHVLRHAFHALNCTFTFNYNYGVSQTFIQVFHKILWKIPMKFLVNSILYRTFVHLSCIITRIAKYWEKWFEHILYKMPMLR